jgi:hypothetical protein
LNQGNQATGNLGNSNALNTISNAMNFGQAYDAKRAGLAQALGVANQTAAGASPANLGFSPVNLAIGQPQPGSQSNFGTGTFSNVNAGTQGQAGGNVMQFGQGVLGSMSSMNNAFTGASSTPDNFSLSL